MAVSGENAGEVVVVGVVCRMWPRTKRNVVEARDVVKDVGRAVLGLPKEPQPQKNLKKGAGFFLFFLGVASLFRVPFLEPFFYSFGINFRGHFRDFF